MPKICYFSKNIPRSVHAPDYSPNVAEVPNQETNFSEMGTLATIHARKNTLRLFKHLLLIMVVECLLLILRLVNK